MLRNVILFLLIIESASLAQAQQNTELEKLFQVVNGISGYYQDTINQHRLVEQTIKTMFERLDPHTVYRTREEAEDDRKKQAASQTGIGIQFRMFNDTMTIVYVRPGGPADKAGIRPGNKVLTIEKSEVSGHMMPYRDVKEILLANREDSITLGISKEIYSQKTKMVKIGKEELTNYSIESYYAPNDSSIYIHISRFSQSTADEFEEILNSFGKKNCHNIILDLRDNAGGMLKTCLEICDHFFEPNLMLLSARGMHTEDKSYFSSEKGLLTGSRICVIINERSASASEVISGAIQDWDRGVVIGRRSFGKGLVQQVFNLADGSQIRVTNAKYYTPSGRCIQKPYKPGNFAEYFAEVDSRKSYGENTDFSKIRINDTTNYTTIRKHRRVYSQSGITPDIFVPEDTIRRPEFWDNWVMSGSVENFVLDYINKHKLFSSYLMGNWKRFCSGFEFKPQIFVDLRSYCESDTAKCMKVSLEEYNKALGINQISEQIFKYLKSRFAYYLVDRCSSRRVLNEDDTDYKTAIRLISKPSEYRATIGTGSR